MTTIVDYGAGNIRSVQNTLDELGADFKVTNDPADVSKAEKIILPGVGHFGQMMQAIDRLRLRDVLLERIHAGIPFLGICIGLQCLFEGSEESPASRGLGLFSGCVRRFVGDARIPHMGWNSLEKIRPSKLLARSRRRHIYLFRAQLLRAGKRSDRRNVHLLTSLLGGSRKGQRICRAVPSRKIRSRRSARSEEFSGNLAMLAKRIIPCLDVTGGRVVKGVNFVGLRDAGDPVELAERYNAQGADELVFLDITASSDAREIMVDLVARTARKVFIPLTVGGGLRTVADARKIILAGADKVSVNTAAVRRPELIRELSDEFGAQAVVLAIDARRVAGRGSGTSTPRAAGTTKASTLSNGPRAANRSEPAKSCSLRWIPMACKPVLTAR